MDNSVDLHLHSTCSDGSFTPAEVVHHAADLGLRVIGLTDHDSVAGVPEAIQVAQGFGIEVVPGCEFSAQADGRDVHLLGYHIDIDSPELQEAIQLFQDARRERAERMVRKLNGLGVKLRIDQVLVKSGTAAIGRPHVADALVEEGFVFSADEAFHKFLGYSKPAYEEKYRMTPSEAVDVIHRAGGLASLAHPGIYRQDDLIPELVAAGVDAIEVRHVKHGPSDVRRYEEVAERYGLLPTGGSDCHGDGRGNAVMGTVDVPLAYADGLRAALVRGEERGSGV